MFGLGPVRKYQPGLDLRHAPVEHRADAGAGGEERVDHDRAPLEEVAVEAHHLAVLVDELRVGEILPGLRSRLLAPGARRERERAECEREQRRPHGSAFATVAAGESACSIVFASAEAGASPWARVQ